jgi:hypothetical protein
MSDFLYATPSFFGGMASILDIGSTLTVYNTSLTPEIADKKAMYADLKVIGDDMRGAMKRFEESLKCQNPAAM